MPSEATSQWAFQPSIWPPYLLVGFAIIIWITLYFIVNSIRQIASLYRCAGLITEPLREELLMTYFTPP